MNEDIPQLTSSEISFIMSHDNGPYVLLEYCRAGRISSESAVTIIEERERARLPRWRRVLLAIFEMGFSR